MWNLGISDEKWHMLEGRCMPWVKKKPVNVAVGKRRRDGTMA
jgi:hypothetical protein